MAAILNSDNLHSAILVFPIKLTHTCQDWFPLFPQETLTHSFWLNLMMSAILNSAVLDLDTAMLDSDTLLSSLRFTQKHSPSTLTLTQTNSIWLTRWWQPSWLLPSWIQPFCSNLWLQLIQSDSNHSFWLNLMMAAILNSAIFNSAILDKKISFNHSHSTWWWQPSWILPSWIRPFCTNLWLQLIQCDSNSFILTELDDCSYLVLCHLEFCHLGFSHFAKNSDSN